MARLPRLCVSKGDGWYHLFNRVAGSLDWRPFLDPEARQALLDIIKKYLRVYFCEAAAFCIMGNHYHLVVRFLEFRRLSRSELYERARLLYRNPDKILRTPEQWERFNRRLFRLSDFMKNVQMAYTNWYNARYQRRGSLWASRFGSVILSDIETVLEEIFYVELNPIRKHLVEYPEEWAASSARLRESGDDDWLIPLEELLPGVEQEYLRNVFRFLLYQRGGLSVPKRARIISFAAFRTESRRGFLPQGIYRNSFRCFTQGLVLGSQSHLMPWLEELRRRGYYRRRRSPVRHRLGPREIFALRRQRVQAVS